MLKRLDLAINLAEKLLICYTCGYALTPTAQAIISHVSSQHRKRKLKKDPTIGPELEKLLISFDLTPVHEARFQPAGRAPIPGISISRGFYCPLKQRSTDARCEFVAGETSTLGGHFKSSHKSDPHRPRPDMYQSYACEYQTVFKGGDRHFFRVRTGLAGQSGPTPYSVFLDTVNAAPPTKPEPEVIKTDELPSFIRGTRWHIFLHPYRTNAPDVVRLIEFPSISDIDGMAQDDATVERILRRLPAVAEAWMQKIYDYHVDASDYVQRILANYPM